LTIGISAQSAAAVDPEQEKKGMTHPALDVIKHRISTNRFDASHRLSDAEIGELVEYASQAPSAYNLQNWRFIAVRDPAAKAKLKNLAYGQQKIADAAVTFIVVGLLHPHEGLGRALEPFVQSGAMDRSTADGWISSARQAYGANERLQRDEAIRSGSLAAMTLMIAAQAQGLASGPMIGFDAAGVSREFGLSNREIPVILVTVGRTGPGNWPRKPRLPVAEILSIV
jgi:nitroreductase